MCMLLQASASGACCCRLLQWCHGASAFTPVLAEAHRALQHQLSEADFMAAAEKAGQVTWECGLLKKVQILELMLCLMVILSPAACTGRRVTCRWAGYSIPGCW